MKRSLKFLTVLAAVSLLASPLFGQSGTPNGNFGGFPIDLQSKNAPAGTVNEPGSQLLYIVDTGVNMRTSGFAPEVLAANNVFELLGVTGGTADIQTNFISITNTHPTQAVTVHFRYFNDRCEDVLDFLVILTCNDTLLFDAFNFEIPGASLNGQPINTKNRVFGPDLDSSFPAISAATFDSGRFLIFATASGTVNNGSVGYDGQFDPAFNRANILFPSELSGGLDGECNIEDDGSLVPQGDRNVGLSPGLVPENLHVFNAAAISFNYLAGIQATSVPKGFIEGGSDLDQFLSYGVNAWARPAVDLSADDNITVLGNGEPDGDGPQLDDYLVLTGNEDVRNSSTRTGAPDGGTFSNAYYLRSELHNGTVDDFESEYGALAWPTIFDTNATGPENQIMHLLSFQDDYDGDNNTGSPLIINGLEVRDRSYNVGGATTNYILQVYDNEEDKLDLESDQPINVSPPPAVPTVADLRIVVDCLRVWINPVQSSSFLRDGLSVFNMNEIAPQVLDGGGSNPDFDGLGAPLDPVGNDASQGWVRLVRDNTRGGTRGFVDNSEPFQSSFVTIGLIVSKFEGFGIGYWAPTVAVDPAVNDASSIDPSP